MSAVQQSVFPSLCCSEVLCCWVKMLKLWQWAAQLSLHFVSYCSPLMQKCSYRRSLRTSYFPFFYFLFFLKLFTLSGTQGSHNVKECPGKQMRMLYTLYNQVWFSFRHCWGMNPCFWQDLGAINYPCNGKGVFFNPSALGDSARCQGSASKGRESLEIS